MVLVFEVGREVVDGVTLDDFSVVEVARRLLLVEVARELVNVGVLVPSCLLAMLDVVVVVVDSSSDFFDLELLVVDGASVCDFDLEEVVVVDPS